MNPNPLLDNIFDTDSYKASHYLQYPPDATGMYSYLESRGGRYGSTVFFGLQYYLQEYLSKPVTLGQVEDAAEFFRVHGEPFNREGWLKVLTKHDGHLPIRIRAVAEGTVVPTHCPLLTVESSDPELFWLVSWVETQLVRLWYPITVATQSLAIKRIINRFLQETADHPAGELPFKLHDFGSRGVSSRESAGIGGMAHLVNFQGSDTCAGVRFANHYYSHPMAAFSIPAMEHSTVTMWGREQEDDAYRNMVKTFAKPGAIFACVSDSYDLWRVLNEVWGGELRDEVAQSGATLVFRPDSGNPPDVVLRAMQLMDRKVGMRMNGRGYLVLPKWIRCIQGDGVDEESISQILALLKANMFSASNLAFGMGGALLQRLDRDTQRFAYKCSAATRGGVEVPVSKDPVTDTGKKSKAGRFSLLRVDGKLTTVPGEVPGSLLQPVFENGKILRRFTLDEVRAEAGREFR